MNFLRELKVLLKARAYITWTKPTGCQNLCPSNVNGNKNDQLQ